MRVGGSTAMTTQQRVGRHQPAGSPGSWKGLSDRAEPGPVVVLERGPGSVAEKYLELVVQDADLEILGTARTNSDMCHQREKTLQDTIYDEQGWRDMTNKDGGI